MSTTRSSVLRRSSTLLRLAINWSLCPRAFDSTAPKNNNSMSSTSSSIPNLNASFSALDSVLSNVNATRAGIVDRFDEVELGVCHIATFLPFTLLGATERQPTDVPHLLSSGGYAAVYLALDMLNRGDGSVVSEVQGLNDRCPIRFTGEVMDTGLNPAHSIGLVSDVLSRQTTTTRSQPPEVCAFIGSSLSSVTLPTALLTGVAGRPHLSPWSTSSQLDDRTAYPLFGRLITSEKGLAAPYVLYLQSQQVRHLGVVHWNDS